MNDANDPIAALKAQIDRGENPFLQSVQNMKARQAGQVGMAITYDERDPDAAAKNLAVGNALGVPPLIVAADPEAYDLRLKMQKASEALRNAPKTAAWLADIRNGVLAKDDLENLSWFERGMRGFSDLGASTAFSRAIARGVVRTKAVIPAISATSSAILAADIGRSVDDLYAEELKRIGPAPYAPVQEALARESAQARFDMASQFSPEDRDRFVREGAAALSRANEVMGQVANIAMSPQATKFRDDDLAKAPDTFLGFFSALAQNPTGGLAFVGEVAAESIPSLLVASAATALTRSPAVGATVMGGDSFLTENASSAIDFLAEKGVALTTPEEAMAVIQNADLMRAANERGLTRGVIIGVMDAISGGVAGKALAKSPIGDVILQGIAQAGFGAGGEGLAQVAAGQQVSWRDIILEGLAELATAPIEVLGVGGRRLLRGSVDAVSSGDTAAALADADARANASKLRERAPDKFKEALDAQGLGDKSVFVPADALKEYFQAKDLSDETMIAWGIDPVAFNEAAQNGNDVAIPLSNYAARIAGTDAASWIAQNATGREGEMSLAEVKKFNASVQDIMQEAFNSSEDARRSDEQLRAADVQIRDQLFSQLRAAGRSPDVAQQEAAFMAAHFVTLGQRTQNDPLDLFNAVGLGVRGPQSPEVRRRDALDIALNTLRAKGAKALKPRGLSLAEFVKAKGGVRDTGGDVAALEPPKGVVAETAQEAKARASQPTLGGLPVTGKGISLEDMGRMAAEAGYFPDLLGEVNAGANKGEATDFAARLLAVLGEDVAGRKVYAEGEGPDADMQALSDAVSAAGLDLATATNDDVAAALDATDGRVLHQIKRGSITLPSGGFGNGQTIINLFEAADLSTFIHEAGHLFLETSTWLGGQDGAPQQLKDDIATIREWTGNTGEAWTVDQHEKFARGLEAYTMEGKAPSLALADAFARFKAWLTRIYKSVLGLNVKLTPEIREVMDRMLATDAEIADARAAQEMRPLFSAAPPSMSEGDFATYQRMARRATETAEQSLLEKTMSKVRREKEAWFRAEKKAVHAEVTAEFNRLRNYRLIDMLANQVWHGSDKPIPDMQIDRKMLVEQFGDGVLAEVSRTKLGGKRAIYGENGSAPDEVAQFFGFKSASEMIAVLQNTQKKRQAVAMEVDRRMTERYGDPLNDGTIEEEALAAIHNAQQANTSVAEARHLATRLGRPVSGMTAKLYRQRARAMIGRMSVRDASRPARFLASERKAARTAQDAFAKVARGTGKAEQALAEALQAKEQQILNGFLYDESRQVAEYVQKGREKMRAYDKKSVRDKLEGDYIKQIDAILEGYDFRVRGPGQIARSENLKAFMDLMIAEGREGQVAIDERLLDEANRKHYTKLSVDELRGLFDTIENIDHLGRFKQKLIDAQKRRELDKTTGEVKAQIDANISGNPPGRVDTAGEKRHRLARDFLNTTLNADTLLREMDGFEDLGPAWVAMKQDINEGTGRLEARRAEAAKSWDKIYDAYSGKERKDMTVRRHIPELNEILSKWDLIAIALNTGNATNFERLTNPKTPGHFNKADLEAAFAAHLDERDWQTVQAIWDHVGSFWDEIVAKEKRQSGVVPKRVEAKPMIAGIPGGITGGYFPIDYDGRLSGLASDLSQKDLAESMMGGRFAKAQTDNGHTKARVKSTGQPLRIDIGIAHRHVDQVLYDLELGEAVGNAWRILQSNDVRGALVAKGRKSDFDALEMWLLDTASGDGSVARGFESVLRRIRSGFTISRLAWNIGTILLQPIGIAQSFVVVGKRAMVRGMTTFMSNPSRWINDVTAVSPRMRERWKTLERDVHTQLGELQTGPLYGYEQFKNKVLMPSFYAGIMKVQFYTVDMPTWVGAYQKKLDETGDETKSRIYADLMVARAQGSGLQPDLGMLQRGSTWGGRKQEFPKLFTTLGSYVFGTFNIAYEQVAKTNFRSPAEVLSLTGDMVLLFTVQAVIYAALRGGLPGGDDDEDGWLEWLAKQTALSAMSTVPGLREFGSAVQGFNGGGVLGSSMDIGARFLHQMSQGEADKAAVKSTVDLVGVAFGLPSSQTNRLIDSILDDDLSLRSDPDPLKALGIGGNREKSLADMIFGNE